MPGIHPSILYPVKLQRLAFVLIIVVVITGVLVLLGWQFNISVFKRPVPGLVAMNPVTAVCFIMSGVAFWLTSSKNKKRAKTVLANILAGMVIAFSLIKLAEAVSLISWQSDKLLFADRLHSDAPGNISNSMAANTALGFLLTCTAVYLFNYQTRRGFVPAHILALFVLLLGYFCVLGYSYGAPEFFDLLRYQPMAVHTAACFILLALAILLADPYKGITRELFSGYSGGAMGRFFVPVALIVPFILGWLRLHAHSFNLSAAFGSSLLVMAIVIVFFVVITANVIALNKKDAERRKNEEKLRQSEEIYRSLVTSVRDYAIFMLDIKGNVITWNGGAEAIKGYKEEDIKGKNISVFYTAEDNARGLPGHVLKMAAELGRFENEGKRVKKDGTEFWADVVVTALYNENGLLRGFAKVTRDITERKNARDMLKHFNEELRRQVQEKTEKLEETTEQLRQLSAHLQNVREDEKRTIAREIHDELGQMLTGLRMDVIWLRKKIATTDETIAARFERTLELLNDTRQIMRRIATNLHPAVLSDLGLIAALNMQCKEFEKWSGIKINFDFDMQGINDMNIAPGISIGVYRIFQESITNIAKHAEARNVTAQLKVYDNNLMLSLQDDGKGFDTSLVGYKKTLGLLSIKERALMMQGNVEIKSITNKGTAVLLTIPLKIN